MPEFQIIGKCSFCDRPVFEGSFADYPMEMLEANHKAGIRVVHLNRVIGKMMVCDDCAEGFYGMIDDIREETEARRHD